MSFAFTKMHGLGNDFVVFESDDSTALPNGAQWRALADRHTGIGFDQALVLTPARNTDTATYYRIFNADGGEVEQCGNGARCVAEWLRLAGRAMHEVRMECAGGFVTARFGAPGTVSVDMGEPSFDVAALPFDVSHARILQANPAHTIDGYALEVTGKEIRFGAVSMGNPHIVIRVPTVAETDVTHIGAALERHAAFPRRVNVGFLETIDRHHGRLRVFERGVGETQACGTGACAAMAVGRVAGLFESEVELHLPGGKLQLRWTGPGQNLWMTGPAAVAFRGELPRWSETR